VTRLIIKSYPFQDGPPGPSGVSHMKRRTAAVGQKVTCPLLLLLSSCQVKQWDEVALWRKLPGLYLQLKLWWVALKLSMVCNFLQNQY